MMIREAFDYSYAVSYNPIAPALDLEELFEKRRWQDRTNFTEHEKQILDQGSKFIELALEGQEIGLQTIREGKLGVDLGAIKAYLDSYRAYRLSDELQNIEFDKVLGTVSSVLSKLSSSNKSPKRALDERETDTTRLFFLALSKVSIKSGE